MNEIGYLIDQHRDGDITQTDAKRIVSKIWTEFIWYRTASWGKAYTSMAINPLLP
jgi:hypothetical protein